MRKHLNIPQTHSQLTHRHLAFLRIPQNPWYCKVFFLCSPNCCIWSPWSCPWSYLVPHGCSISLWTIVKYRRYSKFLTLKSFDIFRCVSTSIFHKLTHSQLTHSLTHNSRTLSFPQNLWYFKVFYGPQIVLYDSQWSCIAVHGPNWSPMASLFLGA